MYKTVLVLAAAIASASAFAPAPRYVVCKNVEVGDRPQDRR